MLDVVLAPAGDARARHRRPGPGVARPGGSAANTARWLGRLGRTVDARSCAVGRDAAGRALVEAVARGRRDASSRARGRRADRADRRARGARRRAERSSRTAAPPTGSAPEDLRADWFAGADAVHLPVYSLLGEPLGRAGRRRSGWRAPPARSVSVDLASIGAAARARPAGGAGADPGRRRRTCCSRPPTRPRRSWARVRGGPARAGAARRRQARAEGRDGPDPRGTAGTALRGRDDAARGRRHDRRRRRVRRGVPGRLARRAGIADGRWPASLQRAAIVGHRTAARQLTTPRPELPLG